MLTHHIQKQIVTKLAFADNLRFSELKIDGIENKLFDYHLKKTISEGWVKKTEEGYRLTPEGKLNAIREYQQTQKLYEQAQSVLFLAVRRKSDGYWLLYKRNVQPLKDLYGFMHTYPIFNESITETASSICRQQTGLSAKFSVKGHGFFRFKSKDDVESFTNFTLLYSDDASGELQVNDEFAQYFWHKDLTEVKNLIPNMADLIPAIKKAPFFIEKNYSV